MIGTPGTSHAWCRHCDTRVETVPSGAGGQICCRCDAVIDGGDTNA